jgi:hypothetical protein
LADEHDPPSTPSIIDPDERIEEDEEEAPPLDDERGEPG